MSSSSFDYIHTVIYFSSHLGRDYLNSQTIFSLNNLLLLIIIFPQWDTSRYFLIFETLQINIYFSQHNITFQSYFPSLVVTVLIETHQEYNVYSNSNVPKPIENLRDFVLLVALSNCLVFVSDIRLNSYHRSKIFCYCTYCHYSCPLHVFSFYKDERKFQMRQNETAIQKF